MGYLLNLYWEVILPLWLSLIGGSTSVPLVRGYNDIPRSYSEVGWYEAFVQCRNTFSSQCLIIARDNGNGDVGKVKNLLWGSSPGCFCISLCQHWDVLAHSDSSYDSEKERERERGGEREGERSYYVEILNYKWALFIPPQARGSNQISFWLKWSSYIPSPPKTFLPDSFH